ncbi:hypothetical protein [Pseudarthrobacter albicanus]|uniref:hypothetical protein n=1 Tax=Pseudarthrobacter albicanus TaxID=2823873 RepID=UPI001BAA75CB|nr:hypothetical protein [Pseudarthrobacter albicanus]
MIELVEIQKPRSGFDSLNHASVIELVEIRKPRSGFDRLNHRVLAGPVSTGSTTEPPPPGRYRRNPGDVANK